uniref:Cytochrome b-c1 complex subunit 6 isoform X1 n=1 Tax=Rhizophora mucronata TaxID=61149 RepID=A0A2P2JPK7_RHIMU
MHASYSIKGFTHLGLQESSRNFFWSTSSSSALEHKLKRKSEPGSKTINCLKISLTPGFCVLCIFVFVHIFKSADAGSFMSVCGIYEMANNIQCLIAFSIFHRHKKHYIAQKVELQLTNK